MTSHWSVFSKASHSWVPQRQWRSSTWYLLHFSARNIIDFKDKCDSYLARNQRLRVRNQITSTPCSFNNSFSKTVRPHTTTTSSKIFHSPPILSPFRFWYGGATVKCQSKAVTTMPTGSGRVHKVSCRFSYNKRGRWSWPGVWVFPSCELSRFKLNPRIFIDARQSSSIVGPLLPDCICQWDYWLHRSFIKTSSRKKARCHLMLSAQPRSESRRHTIVPWLR